MRENLALTTSDRHLGVLEKWRVNGNIHRLRYDSDRDELMLEFKSSFFGWTPCRFQYDHLRDFNEVTVLETWRSTSTGSDYRLIIDQRGEFVVQFMPLGTLMSWDKHRWIEVTFPGYSYDSVSRERTVEVWP